MLRNHGIFDYKIKIGGTPTPSYPTDGLISRWSMDNTSDDSISGFNLSALGTPVYSNDIKKIGDYSHYFNNTNGLYTDSAKPYLIGGNPWTISFWYYAVTGGSWYDPMFYFSRTSDATWDRIYFVNQADASLTAYAGIQYGGSGGTISPFNVYTNPSTGYNEWHMYTLTYSKPTLTAYLDTVPKGTGSQTNNLRDYSQRLGFGYRPESTGFKAKGYMCAVYLYNKALSQSEINQLYNGGSGI
jgi:hypothetical protein